MAEKQPLSDITNCAVNLVPETPRATNTILDEDDIGLVLEYAPTAPLKADLKASKSVKAGKRLQFEDENSLQRIPVPTTREPTTNKSKHRNASEQDETLAPPPMTKKQSERTRKRFNISEQRMKQFEEKVT